MLVIPVSGGCAPRGRQRVSISERQRPFSQACEENKGPILEVIGPLFAGVRSVLEIGSGTAQHAVAFAAALPHLTWHTSDRRENHPGIRLWIAEAGLENLPPPLDLDVARGAWPEGPFEAVFSANTAHIMSWPEVRAMFRGVARVLTRGGVFALYGPFNRDGRYTSASNARFDRWLKERDRRSGIKDLAVLDALARELGMELVQDHAMPVNNRTLVWRRSAAEFLDQHPRSRGPRGA